ncbi:hypothetical protein FQN52_001823 [Onygenales sp. PD_12]|nr:hypothetical protein FQN52_001823 [Onygenales sp. PD_12]
MNRILQLIQEMREPTMKLSSFLKSPALQAFCHKYDAQSLAEIHTSFSNMDRFRAMIQKQRLLAFPAGQSYNGVLFELERNPALKEYVQEIYQDPDGLMIICMLKEQASLLLSLSSFEVDMSYKRLKSSKMNEVVFATYLPQFGKIITLCRIFTEQENPNGDMDNKQMTGLAQYLAEVDSEHRPYQWQLKNIMIFCHIHFFRSITKAVGSQDHVENEKVRNWAAHKKNQVIAAGLNKFCSLIPADVYDSVRNHTNAAEQTHNKSYAFGRGQTLLQGVLSAWKLDTRDMIQYDARKQYGIHHSYRTDNMRAQYQRHVSRQESLRRKRPSAPADEVIDLEDDTHSIRPSRAASPRPRSRPRSIPSSSPLRSSPSLRSSPPIQSSPTRHSSPRGRSRHGIGVHNSQQLRRVASSNLASATLNQGNTLERERDLLELERQKLEIRKMQEELQAKELENESKRLDLEERRFNLERRRRS